jgi:uncharacterized protein (DUF433 family)
MNSGDRITLDPGTRRGKPRIRSMRITVDDVLGWLAAGMSNAEILTDFPELTLEDIQACIEFSAGDSGSEQVPAQSRNPD